MMVDIPPVSGVSWKDKLLGRRGPGPSDGANGMDLEIEDGDILRSTINVVKLLGRNIRYGVLHNRIYSLLRPSQPFLLMDVENGYYLVQFQNRDDYDMALTQGPWIVFRHYLTDFCTKKKVLEDIRSLVGTVAKLDIKSGSGARGQFARMEVFVDLEKLLTSQVLINGRVH
ncbi:hypothetical protein Golax_010536 [Gossypium laxum]|uniref:DUF4283 domain-containing protein n=2 Tax=Gossypium TaxID=3633 RepID=A0A7J8ZHS6_9ROSI|nr:hypothetical protein [Gossypium laxum]